MGEPLGASPQIQKNTSAISYLNLFLLRPMTDGALQKSTDVSQPYRRTEIKMILANV